MQKHERAALRVVEQIVEPLGLTACFERGKRHPGIRIEGRGHRHRLALSGSPRTSEVEAIGFARQQATRWLRSEGLLPQ